ncbi:MAG: hypothetical protein JRN15_10030 [Nitrososphaerota archaeon]|nr:hypothetical protein [Nitrososphaerota archaeon]
MKIRPVLLALGLIAIITISSPVIALRPSHAQSSVASIVVQVSDPQGVNVDGAMIEIYLQTTNSIVSAGRTVNGTFVSAPLQTGLSYNVVASTAVQTQQQTVVLFNGSNYFVQFTLITAYPVSQIVLSNVTGF